MAPNWMIKHSVHEEANKEQSPTFVKVISDGLITCIKYIGLNEMNEFEFRFSEFSI